MKIFAGNTGFFRTDILVDQEAYETAKELIEQYQQE
jgi:hypothetical protein